MRALIVGTLLLILVLTGTAIIAVMRPAGGLGPAGSGATVHQNRAAGPFTRVRSNGSIDVVIDANAQAPGVTVSGTRAEADRVETSVSAGTLTISQRPGVSVGFGLQSASVAVSVPGLRSLSVAGSGDAKVRNVRSGSLTVDLAGSGDVDVAGTAGSLALTVSGSGNIEAAALDVRDATVDIAGSGDVKVRATSSLDARIAGSGDLVYSGSPKHVSKSITGSGTISGS